MSESCCQLKKSKSLAPMVNALFASIIPGEHIDASLAEILATGSDAITSGGTLERLEAIVACIDGIACSRFQNASGNDWMALQSLPIASGNNWICLRTAFGIGIAPNITKL